MEYWMRRLDVLKKFENDYNLMIHEIERYVVNPKTAVNVTKEEIVTYLNKVAKDNGVDMNEPDNWGGNILLGENFDVEARMKEFHKHLEKERYKLNEVDYKYFNDCIKIYKDKLGKYCMIARMLSTDYPEDKDLLKQLDIRITDKEVLERDVDRLFKPLYENYKLLKETVVRANNLETYLNKILNEHTMNMDGVSYYECLPSKELLQQYYMFPRETKTSMNLTQKQIDERKEKEKNVMKNLCNDLLK